MYKLEIRDIIYNIGVKSYVEHNNFEYASIKELFTSVKNTDIVFDIIYLEINLIF